MLSDKNVIFLSNITVILKELKEKTFIKLWSVKKKTHVARSLPDKTEYSLIHLRSRRFILSEFQPADSPHLKFK